MYVCISYALMHMREILMPQQSVAAVAACSAVAAAIVTATAVLSPAYLGRQPLVPLFLLPLARNPHLWKQIKNTKQIQIQLKAMSALQIHIHYCMVF